MDQQNLPTTKTTPTLTTLSSDNGLILKASAGLKIYEDSNKSIIEAVQYVIGLLGLAKERMPSKEEMSLIVLYARTHWRDFTANDVRVAFDLAVQKRFVVNLELFGGTLSAKFISDVLNEYKAYKRQVKLKSLPKPIGMNNVQRMDAIVSILSKDPKTIEKLKEIGTVKKADEKPKEKLPYYDLHQKWFRQFDKLHMNPKFCHDNVNGIQISGRWIKRYGQIMNIEMFFNKKVEQLQLAHERNNDLI